MVLSDIKSEKILHWSTQILKQTKEHVPLANFGALISNVMLVFLY